MFCVLFIAGVDAGDQDIGILLRVEPLEDREHICTRKSDAAAGAAGAAVQEDGAAAVGHAVRRPVELDYAGIGVGLGIVFQVLYVVAPFLGQLRVAPFLPGVEVDGILVADPVGVGRYLPPGDVQL